MGDNEINKESGESLWIVVPMTEVLVYTIQGERVVGGADFRSQALIASNLGIHFSLVSSGLDFFPY